MKHLFTLLILFITCSVSLQAQIVYHDIEPDTTVDDWEYFDLHPNPSANAYLAIWFHPWSPNQVVITSWFGFEILWDGQYPAKLEQGDMINASSGTWMETSYDTLNVNGRGNWQGVTDKYLAYRYMVSGQWEYGWLRMDVTDTPSSFTVKDWAYNTAGSGAIASGERNAAGVDKQVKSIPRISVVDKAISFPGIEQGEATIYDLSGRLLLQAPLQIQNKINLHAYPAGIYIVKLDHLGQTQRFKFQLP